MAVGSRVTVDNVVYLKVQAAPQKWRNTSTGKLVTYPPESKAQQDAIGNSPGSSMVTDPAPDPSTSTGDIADNFGGLAGAIRAGGNAVGKITSWEDAIANFLGFITSARFLYIVLGIILLIVGAAAMIASNKNVRAVATKVIP